MLSLIFLVNWSVFFWDAQPPFAPARRVFPIREEIVYGSNPLFQGSIPSTQNVEAFVV
jgi:hypothetical protein